MTTNNCPICLSREATISYGQGGVDVDAFAVDCPLCGRFQLSRTLAATDVEHAYGPRWILSAAIRNRYEKEEDVTLLTNTVETLLKLARLPTDPFESINLLLRHTHRMAEGPGKAVEFNVNTDFPLVYARDPEEFAFYITKARELGLIEPGSKGHGYRLGLEGWRRLLDLDKTEAKSDQAFVAMWFDPSLTPAYSEGIAPALEESGYPPTRVDLLEHNEKIDDRIIAEIRRSGLLVADFTGHRGGVYFEVGFAMGLGLPVILTCRADQISNAHFDTRQYNHIVWDEPADLKQKLIDRIAATLPRPGRPAV